MGIYWIALSLAILFTVIGETLFKIGALRSDFSRQLRDWRTLLGVAVFGAAAVFYMLALRRIPMSIAMPSTAASYVAIALIGRFVFREPISPVQVAGLSILVAGVCLLTYGSA